VSSQREEEPVLVPTSVTSPRQSHRPAVHTERIALVDLLDRVLAGGVVVSGEVTLAIADVDMVRVSLRALVTSASALARGASDDEDDEGVPGR
jgi:gas vesicle protein GvpA/GvpJ/GvpM family